MTRIDNLRNSRGSLSLEAAIVMPMLLAFGIALLGLLQCYVCEIKIKNALDRAAAEISLLSPVFFLADESGLSAAYQGLSGEITKSVPTELFNQLLGELFPGQTAETLFDDLVLDLSTSVLLGPLVQKRIDYWLAEACSGQPGWQSRLGQRWIYLDWQVANHKLLLFFKYDLMTPIGTLQRQTSAVVPLWTSHLRVNTNRGADEVWMIDNFARGRKIRQVFGANMPDNFPVIASFADGHAMMIRSVDLTAPTYRHQDRTRYCLLEMIDELAAFNGAAARNSDPTIDAQAIDIKRKSILLVIPSNAEQSWLPVILTEVSDYASSLQIVIRVERYGKSSRYCQDEQDRLVTSAGLRYHFNVTEQSNQPDRWRYWT